MQSQFKQVFSDSPIIAILRGVRPSEAVKVGEALVCSGINIIEVPLNSPQPYESIRLLTEHLPQHVIVGAGTVMTEYQVNSVKDAGGKIILSPNMNPRVISESVELGLVSVPGIATVTEAFSALEYGADILKVFPAACAGTQFFKQINAVMPDKKKLLAVGGVELDNLADFMAAGAAGVGIGSSLYSPGKSVAEVKKSAHLFTQILKPFVEQLT